MAVKKSRRRVTVKTKKVSLKKNVYPEFDFTLDKITQYIKERAYYIWEELGRPQDKDLEIWCQAEREVLESLIKKK